MKRPIGVAVLAAICLVLAVAQAFTAAANAASGGSPAAAVGALFAAAFAVVGVSLWRLRESGRHGALALAALQLLKSLIAAGGLVTGLRARTGTTLGPGQIAAICALMGVLVGAPIAVLFYLTRPRIKALFTGPNRNGSNPPAPPHA